MAISFNYEEWKKKQEEEAKKQAQLTQKEQAMGGKVSFNYDEWKSRQIAEAKGETYTPIPPAAEYVARTTGVMPTVVNVVNDDVYTGKKAGGDKDSWFKSGGFSDGVDGVGDFFGDLGETVLGTTGDIILGLGRGVGRLAEGIVDLGIYAAGGVGSLFGADEFAEAAKKTAQFDAVDALTRGAVDYVDQYSVLGNKADSVVEGLGQVGGIILTGGLGAAGGLGALGTTVLTTAVTGLSSMGTNMGEAYDAGATDAQAFLYGLSTGAIEAAVELASGGLGKAVKAIGISRGIGGLDDMFAKNISNAVTKAFTNEAVQKVAGNTIEAAVKAGGEGLEEVASGFMSAVMKKLTYASDEDFDKLVKDEKLLEQFVVGAITSSIAQGSDYVKANASKTDFVTGMTSAEEKVINKAAEQEIAKREANGEKLTNKQKNEVYDRFTEDISKGYISIDTIEETLGGDKYTEYKKAVDENDALKKELDELRNMESGKMTDIQKDRLAELKAMNLDDTSKIDEMKKQMSDDVFNFVKSERKGKGSLLMESYNEKTRRGEGYTVDLKTVDSKKQDTYKRAMEAGILNNTNRTHDFVDLIATLESERGVKIDFANNQRLKESGFSVDGAIVNGVKTDNGILLNVESGKSLDTVVGHEITHVLEGTELYQTLQDSIIKYAQSKGDYDTRYANIAKLYKTDDDVKIKQELTADLVGDYLFADENFIKSLTANPSVFKKIFNEVKYLVKIATAGSESKRKLLEVQRTFERVWADTKATKNTTNDGGVQVKSSVTDTDVETQFSLEQIDDTYYVRAEKKLFTREDGTPASEREIFKALVGTTLHLPDGDVKIVKNLPKKEMYDELYKRRPAKNKMRGVEKPKQLNAAVNYNMEELLNNSSLAKANEPDKNNEHADQGITSFDIRTVKFYDGEKAYDIGFSIGNLQNGEKVAYAKKFFGYDAELTKKIQTAETSGRADNARSSRVNQQSVFSEQIAPIDDSISQNSEKSSGLENISEKAGQFSLSEVSETDKNAHVKTAQEYFGTTYKWDETGYITLDGKRLDFSGKHDGAPGGYRTVDHRDIRDALGLDYGGDDYSGGMIQFMAEGNIRISPEDNGINLSVMPTEAQMQTLDSFITRVRGEVVLDIDDLNGNTIFSMEYPRGTYSKKILQDIEARLKKGGDNYISPLSQFRESLSSPDEIAPVGKYTNLGIQEDIAPLTMDNVEAPTSLNGVDNTVGGVDGNQTVSERIAAQIENFRAEMDNDIKHRENAIEDFDISIAMAQAEYDALKNKTTRKANDILRRIERLERLKSNVDADFQNRIDNLQKRIDKLGTVEYKRAEQRRAKQQTYTEETSELMGDTSTWRDKKLGISYQTNTLRRNLRDIVRDANGNKDIARADRIYDYLQGTYNHNEAQLKQESRKIKKPFADMKINKYESTYAQMLGELRHNPETTLTKSEVDKYLQKHKGKIDTDKVDKIISEARKVYDDLIKRVNEVLREQGMREIAYRKGYFPHFTEDKQSFLGKLFNWKTKNDDIPTDIAGLTETFEPVRSYQSFNKQRTTDKTDYNFKKGFDTYVHGALDWIYHIEDIQKRRAFENEIRYRHSEQGVQKKIDEIKANTEYDADEAQRQIDSVFEEARNPLNNFVTDFRRGTQTLAGKKSSADREMEYSTNRKIYSTMTNISNRVSANMVAGSISSALTNFIPITQSWSQVSPIRTIQAMRDTIRNYVRDDGTIMESDFLTNRLMPEENLDKTTWDKIGEKVGGLMETVDGFTSQVVWRSKYLDNIKKGMSESQAIANADAFAEGIMAGRSRGNMPTIFDSKNPITKMLTAFQLEVANQYGYMFKDMPNEIGTKNIGKLVNGYAGMFVGAYVYNALYSALTGRDAAFDPIGILEDLLKDLGFGDDDEEEVDVFGAVSNLAENVAQEIPFVGGLLGGGRVPISSALPYDMDFSEAWTDIEGMLTAEDNEKYKNSFINEITKPLWYGVLPMGGGQIRKTVQGLSMFSDDHPVAGSYTDSGNLRYPVEDTIGNRVQAALFGQYANENARYYFDNDLAPLKENQIQEYIDVGMPIEDYWDYREGLSKLKTNAEKIDYIDSLDLTAEQKNILANNILDRETPVDMTNYGDYSSLEEFDFAYKYPEKYEIAQTVGGYDKYVEYQEGMKGMKLAEKVDYVASLDLTTEQKNALINGETDRKEPIDLTGYENYSSFEEFEYAKNNPTKYSIAKAVGGYDAYMGYSDALNDIKSDKDANGKTINGSRKEKVIRYIDSLDISYGEKIILFRSEYNADDSYNYDIIKYLEAKEGMTYEEKLNTLRALGFTVNKNGNIYW